MAKTNETVTKALACFRLATTAEQDQRERERDDLACQIPENLWPDDVKRSRKGGQVAGIPIPDRPMLSIPMLDQPIQLILNQEKAAQLGAQIHPLSEEADDDTAQTLQGLYRSIEVRSRAQQARSWAFERAVLCGRGWYRILTAYDPAGGHPSDQEIRIVRIVNQGAVYGDPFAQEPDKSDAEWLLQVEDVAVSRYKRLYPKSKLSACSDDELVGVGSAQPGWINGATEESRTIRVAEYWYVEHDTADPVDGDENETPVPSRVIHWCKVNCQEELESEEWGGQYIPYVFVPGREMQPFDQEAQRYTGIIGPNKEAARLFNYAASGAVESAALEPKAPFDVDPEEIEGYESWWQQANVRNFPYLPRRKFLHGQVMPQIGRIQADASKMQINLALLNQASGFLHSGTGAFEPTLGQQSAEAKSGRAVLALQQQHDQGNSNWLDNLAQISMLHEARIILDLIPHVYDRPGRVLRILDLEDNPKKVMVNAPFVEGPQGQPQRPMMPAPPSSAPPQPGQPPQPPAAPVPIPAGHPLMPPNVKHFDLAKGRYGVTASIGKAYQSRLIEGADKLGQLFQAEPQLFQILGDLYLKFQDFPGHMEASERVKKMLPPQLQDPGKDGPDPAQAAAHLSAQLQQTQAELQKAQQFISTKQAEQQGQMQIAQLRAQTELQKAGIDADRTLKEVEMKNATAIAVAHIAANSKGAAINVHAAEEAQALGHEALQNSQDRLHDVQMASIGHQQGMDSAQQQADLQPDESDTAEAEPPSA